MLNKNSCIVMQGDSITDCNRGSIANGFGGGYAKMVAQTLLNMYSSLDLKVYNKGVSGNRVCDMQERWEQDCISLQPNILTILIGINDIWRQFDSNITIDFLSVEKSYEHMLSSAKDIGTKIIMLEPFAIPCGVVNDSWYQSLGKMIHMQRNLAMKYADLYIPLDGIFASKLVKVIPCEIAADGVHPSEYGHRIIAEQVIKGILSL